MNKEAILTKLPDHSEELKNILALSRKSYDKFISDMSEGLVTDRKRRTYKYIFENYLYAVADLSMEVNEVEDPLRIHYKKEFKETPALGNKLFYEEFFGLHKEYDKVKRFIWKAIYKVDADGIVEHGFLN